MTDVLTFNPANHTYELNGKRLPGVTTIIGASDNKSGLLNWYGEPSENGKMMGRRCWKHPVPRHLRRYPAMPVQCSCLTCGATVIRSPSMVKARVFCGSACFAAYTPPSPPIIVDGAIASVPLISRTGAVVSHAIIDASDADWARKWTWRLNSGYAVRYETDGSTVFLHRELLGLPRSSHTTLGDHINRQRLDCRRQNLREITSAGNTQNRSLALTNTSGYRGVSLEKRLRSTPWRAQASVGGRQYNLGYYATREEAAGVVSAWRKANMPYTVESVQ